LFGGLASFFAFQVDSFCNNTYISIFPNKELKLKISCRMSFVDLVMFFLNHDFDIQNLKIEIEKSSPHPHPCPSLIPASQRLTLLIHFLRQRESVLQSPKV
jgi:hypothetical protein